MKFGKISYKIHVLRYNLFNHNISKSHVRAFKDPQNIFVYSRLNNMCAVTKLLI